MPTAQAPVRDPSTDLGTLTWPLSALYVSDEHRLVYCPIQKVACSSLKLWWASIHGRAPDDFFGKDHRGAIIDHRKLNATYRLLNFPHLGLAPLTDDNWFRIVFVRNPWARLVSAFLNKFVEAQPLARPVYKVVHRRWRNRTALRLRDAVLSPLWTNRHSAREQLRDTLWPALLGQTVWEEELTFRHFVEYLSGCDLDRDNVDMHWRPQYRFLGELPFQFVGRFERLADDMRTVAALAGVSANLPSVNRTRYETSQDRTTCVADYSLRELRQMPSLPSYRQFYTRQLSDQVGQLFHRDIEQFDYRFAD